MSKPSLQDRWRKAVEMSEAPDITLGELKTALYKADVVAGYPQVESRTDARKQAASAHRDQGPTARQLRAAQASLVSDRHEGNLGNWRRLDEILLKIIADAERAYRARLKISEDP